MGDYTYAYAIEAARLVANINAAITSAIFDISNHSARHEFGGADVISLAGLAVAIGDVTGHDKTLHDGLGLHHGDLTGLADDDHPQYATNTEFDNHSARHENGGADVLSLAGLAVAAADLTGNIATDRMSTNIAATLSRALNITADMNIESNTLFVGHAGGSYPGRIGIGTATPGNSLHINSSDSLCFKVSRTGTNGIYAVQASGNNVRFINEYAAGSLCFYAGGNDRVTIQGGGGVIIPGVYNDTLAGTANVIVDAAGHLQRATSNEKHKKNIKDLTLDTSKIYNLKPREFQWDHKIEELRETKIDKKGGIEEGEVIRPKQTITKDHVGLIAEEAGEFATHNILTGEPDGIEWNAIVTALLVEVKQLKERIETLEKK